MTRSLLELALGPYVAESGLPEAEVAVVMAGLLEFGGSMRLADRLAEPLDRSRAPLLSTAAPMLEGRIERDIDLLRTRVERAFETVRPRAVKLWSAIEDAGAWANPGLAAGTLWGPIAEVIGSRLEAVQSTSSEIRHEIALELRAGPGPTHLEALDAVLHEAMRGATQKLFARVVPAMEVVFVRDVTASMSKLPEFPRREQLESWCRRDGCVGKHVRAGRDIVMAVLEIEADRLIALVHGCLGTADR